MPAKLKRKVVATPVLLCGVVGLGWGLWPVHWTSQSPLEFPAATGRYRLAVSAVVEAAPAASFVHTGHRAGSFEEFAKNLHTGIPAAPKPVTELMDRAFDELGLTSIEIDVRSSPSSLRDVVVVHDAVDGGHLDQGGREYVERNTLRSLLAHYLEQGHHLRGKRIAIEVKAPRGELDEAARDAVDRTASTLDELLGSRADEGQVRGLIDVLSFSHAALERMVQALGPRAVSHGLYQVVTSNRFPEWVYRFGQLPPFDEGLRAKLRDVPWLRGVFFDPRFVDGFAQLFNGINQARQARGWSPLEMHVSTYSHHLDGLIERLQAEPEPLRHVHGLIYQIRKR